MRVSTAVFALATLFSRIAGMVRTAVVAALFHTSNQASAFTIAFQIPNLIRSLVADAALSAAFVPVFTELREQRDESRAWRIASTFAGLIVLVLGPLCVLCMVLAEPIVGLFADRGTFGAADFQLAVDLTRIMLPIVVLMALSGLVVGILNAYDHFGSPAFAPVAWNAVILLALIGVVPFVGEGTRIYVYAWGVLAGTVVQLAVPMPWLRGRGGRFRLLLAWRDPKVREILMLMLPVTISLGLINVQLLIGSAFATRIPPEAIPAGLDDGSGPAVLDFAFRLYMLPQGIFSVAVSTVFFPALARLAARGDTVGFRSTFTDGLRQIFALLLPSALFLLVLAEPVVRLLYEHSRFDAHDTAAVTAALVGYSVGLVFNGASLLLIRSFFSLKRPWVPTVVAALTLVVNTVVILALYRNYGTTGIAVATSIVNVVQFVVMYVLLQRMVGRLDTRRTVVHVLLATVAAVLATGAGWLAWRLVDRLAGDSLLGQVASVGAACAVVGTVYLLTVVRLRLVGTDTLRAMVGRRTLPGDGASGAG